MATGIQWTDETWNPVTGCSKVSPGCAHCYAEGVADRFWAKQYPLVKYVTCSATAGCDHSRGDCSPFEESRPRQFTDVMCHEDRLDQPLRWRKPRRIFVNSMSDLFHEDVPDEFIDKVFAVMALAYQHTFQVLTKRPERMRTYLSAHDVGIRWLATIYRQHSGRPQTDDQAYQEGDAVRWTREGMHNVWLGVSVENQRFADELIPLLLQTPAAVRFISAEPLLGPVDLGTWLYDGYQNGRHALGLTWVIVGGESGIDARPFDIAWARSIVEQCRAAAVPVFVKQLGSRCIDGCFDHHDWPAGTRAHVGATMDAQRWIQLTQKGGDTEEWPEDLRVREFPKEAKRVEAIA